jgi:hypothetical protein
MNLGCESEDFGILGWLSSTEVMKMSVFCVETGEEVEHWSDSCGTLVVAPIFGFGDYEGFEFIVGSVDASMEGVHVDFKRKCLFFPDKFANVEGDLHCVARDNVIVKGELRFLRCELLHCF